MSEVKKILLLGAGGHCLSVLDSLLSSENYIVGIIDKNKIDMPNIQNSKKNLIMDIPILGNDDDLINLYSKGYTDAFVTVGSIGDVSLRKKLYNMAKRIGFRFPNIIDKSSVVSNYAILGEGIYIGKNTVVNASAKIGNCAIINTASIIEHECIIEDFVHIAPGSVLSGKVKVAEDTHIGAGSIIKEGIHIGSGSMIGMGSVVVNNIGDKVTAYGNPCKEVKHE
jgi:sugar O-acyltransferase (sialic acid O-acetyltransferase NeuD family)